MSDKLLLAEYFVDCGRMGELEGLFLTTQQELDQHYGKTVYWGEVLGKHSDVTETFTPDQIVIKTDDQEFLTKMIDVLNLHNTRTISGFNPIERIQGTDYGDEDEYKDDLKEVMTSVMTARMGQDGSKATFQWFKEHNIAIDSAMYIKIQQVIEAGRNEFQNAQTRLVDVKGTYQTALGSIPQGWFLSMAGYPKIDLDKYRPVVAGDTRKAFEEGVQAPIQMRKKAQ